MQKKIILTLAALNVLLFMILSLSVKQCKNEKEKKEDYLEFLKEEKEIRIRDSKNQQHLKKKVEELSRGRSLKDDPEWGRLLKEIEGLKARRVISGTVIGSRSEYHIETTVRDSVIFDTVRIKCFGPYKDEWISLSGCGGKFDIKTRDSLVQFIYMGKRSKKFLFFRVGPREMTSEIVNFNPGATVTYNRNVMVKKKKP